MRSPRGGGIPRAAARFGRAKRAVAPNVGTGAVWARFRTTCCLVIRRASRCVACLVSLSYDTNIDRRAFAATEPDRCSLWRHAVRIGVRIAAPSPQPPPHLAPRGRLGAMILNSKTHAQLAAEHALGDGKVRQAEDAVRAPWLRRRRGRRLLRAGERKVRAASRALRRAPCLRRWCACAGRSSTGASRGRSWKSSRTATSRTA